MIVSLSRNEEASVVREVLRFCALSGQRTSDCIRALAACICTRLRGVGNLASSPSAQVPTSFTAFTDGVGRHTRTAFDWLTSFIELIIHKVKAAYILLKASPEQLTERLARYFSTLVRLFREVKTSITVLNGRINEFLSDRIVSPRLRKVGEGMEPHAHLLSSYLDEFLRQVRVPTSYSKFMTLMLAARRLSGGRNAFAVAVEAFYVYYFGSTGLRWEYAAPVALCAVASRPHSRDLPTIAYNAVVEEILCYYYDSPWLTDSEQFLSLFNPSGDASSTILVHMLLTWARRKNKFLGVAIHVFWNCLVLMPGGFADMAQPAMLIPDEIRLKYRHGEDVVKQISEQVGVNVVDGRVAFTTGSNAKAGKGHIVLAAQNSACYSLASHNAQVAGKRLFDVGSGPRAVPHMNPASYVHFNTPNLIRGDQARQRSVGNSIREHDKAQPLYEGRWTQCHCPLLTCPHVKEDDFLISVHSIYYLSPEELAIVAAHDNLIFAHPLSDAFGKYDGGYHITDGKSVNMYTLSQGIYELWSHPYPAVLHGTVPAGDRYVVFVADTTVPAFLDTVCGQIEFSQEPDPMTPFNKICVGDVDYYGRESYATRDLSRVMPGDVLESLRAFVVGKNPSQLGLNSFLAHLRANTAAAFPQVLEAYGDIHHYVTSREAGRAENESIETHLTTAAANYSIGASRDNTFSVFQYISIKITMAVKRLLMFLVRFKIFARIYKWFQGVRTLPAMSVEAAYGSYLCRKNQIIPLETGVYKLDGPAAIPTSEMTPKPVVTRLEVPRGELVLPSGHRVSHLAGIQCNRIPIFPSSSSHNQYHAMTRQVLEVPEINDQGIKMLKEGYDELLEMFPPIEQMKAKWDPEAYYKQYVADRPAHVRESMLKEVLNQPSPAPASYQTFVKYEATANQNKLPRNISADSESCKVTTGPIARFYSEMFKQVWSPDTETLYFCGRSSDELSQFLLASGMFEVDKNFNFTDAVVLEIDQSKYDAHVSRKAKELELQFLDALCTKYLGAVPVENQHLRAILTQRFKSSCGIKFTDPNSRASGSSATSYGNSSLSLAMLAAIFRRLKQLGIKYWKVVIGDDSLVVLRRCDWEFLRECWGCEQLEYITNQYKAMGFTVDLILRENLAHTTFCSGRFYPVVGRLKYLYGQMIGRQLTKMGIFGCPKSKLQSVLFGASISNRICFSHIPILNDINEVLYAECQAQNEEKKIPVIMPDEYKHRIAPAERFHQTARSRDFVCMAYGLTTDQFCEVMELLAQLKPAMAAKAPRVARQLKPLLVSSDILIGIMARDLDA